MALVRRVRIDEWREFRRLRLEALQDAPTAYVERYDDAAGKPDAYWQERVQHGAEGIGRVTVVADEDGRLVGTASCFLEEDITDHISAHVVGVYVTPAWRGRDKLPDRLITAAVRWAREERAAERVRLFVTAGNERAAACYRRIGFAATGATVPYPHDPRIAEHEMVLK